MTATASLADIALEVLTPLDAPASFVHSQLIGPEEPDAEATRDVDEWVALDDAVALQIVQGGGRVVLRVPALALAAAPRLAGLSYEAVIAGPSAEALAAHARALVEAVAAGLPVRAALAGGDTGIDCYRAAAVARRAVGTRLPVRARWDSVLDVKGAALALTFGADELAGPLAPPIQRVKLAQIGGPPEESGRPSPAYVESLIRAAGRLPLRGIRS